MYHRNTWTLDDDLWHQLVQQHLLRRSEVEFLRSLPLRPRLLTMCHMTADLSRAQLKEEEFLGVGKHMFGRFVEMLHGIMSFKESLQELCDLSSLDVPIQYKHLLSLTVFLNLLFLAYGMALSDSAMAPTIFIVMDLALLGMLDVAHQLWNPFRSKSLEFALEEWKEDFRNGLRTILNYQHAGATQQWKQDRDAIEAVGCCRSAAHVNARDDEAGSLDQCWSGVLEVTFPLRPASA
eukprot:Skav225017  [mRNA]  locus=scaffold3954:23320:27965:- [translate_table: standard]